MDVTIEDLVGCLRLTRSHDGALRGPNLDIGYHRIFGGQILAQLVAVTAATVPDKTLASLSVAFPREGDASVPIDYRVTVAHAGRRFATLGVVATQRRDDRADDGNGGEDRVVAVAQASMAAGGADAALHHSSSPPEVGAPGTATERRLDLIPWEVRVVDDVDLADRAPGPAVLNWWMRAPVLDAVSGPSSPEPAGVAVPVDRALLAHATDLTVIGTALRPIEGFSEADSGSTLTTAVTTHSLWFHQPFRLSEWLLVTQDAPVVADGRAFGRGEVFSGDQLVASFAQGSMIRTIDAPTNG